MSLRKASVPGEKHIHSSPWTRFVERPWADGPGEWYTLMLPDYVSVLAQDRGGEVLLVRQFRPAVQKVTLELVCGLHEEEPTPLLSVQREVAEEVGFGGGHWTSLGSHFVDTGRLDNSVHFFHVSDLVPLESFEPETGIETEKMALEDFKELVSKGGLENGLQMTCVMLAQAKGLI